MLHRLALCCMSNGQIKSPSGEERAPGVGGNLHLCGEEGSSALVPCLSKCLLSLNIGPEYALPSLVS